MHFITFPVASTNIFPLSNSTKGGQLVTEYNLKSREMVATNPEVKYAIGPSFLHSLDDFRVTLLSDSEVPEYNPNSTYAAGDYCMYLNVTYVCTVAITTPEPFNIDHWKETSISSSILQLAPGRAVVNGHYVESLSPITIDLIRANVELQQRAEEPLYGNLSIGLRTYFSESTTMAGAMLVENTDNMYIGVQVVIERTPNFKTPNDCPTDQSQVTADIKIADFTFINGVVPATSISMNHDALGYISPDRVLDFASILDEKYVTSENLIDRLFYTFSGKSKQWCDSTNSLMVWDSRSWDDVKTTVEPTRSEAGFVYDNLGRVNLAIPHKQPDGEILNDNNQRLFYKDKYIPFPMADYNTGAPGAVSAAYTNKIKYLESIMNTYKQFTNGKQIYYLLNLKRTDEGLTFEFPDANNYNIGDYIVVREDYTVSGTNTGGYAPSTIYLVLPGGVTSLEFVGTEKPAGVRLGVPQVLYEGEGAPVPTADVPTSEELLQMFMYPTYVGTFDDYFEISYHHIDETVASYYYKVASTGPHTWSSPPVLLTGGVPLATTEQLGGFYNVDEEDSAYIDNGYIYVDATGHLRLMDYSLLRMGALAYQLGAAYEVPSYSTLSSVQASLDDRVNARVAFYTQPQLDKDPQLGSIPPMIDIDIPLPTDSGVLNIYGIDSRFNTGVYLHFNDVSGGDYSQLVINISDCQKIRIDNNIANMQNGPVINIFRSCLYYDYQVIDYIRTCDPSNLRQVMYPEFTGFTGFSDLTLWYARFNVSDPDLTVNGMEVSQPNVSLAAQDISFWSDFIPNDNHYGYALRSITLSNSGHIIGCSLFVANVSTQIQIQDTTKHVIIGGKFVLPQGSALNYPKTCLNSAMSITGTFTTAYLADNQADWITTDTSFTAKTGVYNFATGMEDGSIAFNSNTYLVPTTYTNVDTIGGWEPGSYHIFYGGTTV